MVTFLTSLDGVLGGMGGWVVRLRGSGGIEAKCLAEGRVRAFRTSIGWSL